MDLRSLYLRHQIKPLTARGFHVDQYFHDPFGILSERAVTRIGGGGVETAFCATMNSS